MKYSSQEGLLESSYDSVEMHRERMNFLITEVNML